MSLKYPEEDEEEIREVTASQAAANRVSVGTAVSVSELDGIFTYNNRN